MHPLCLDLCRDYHARRLLGMFPEAVDLKELLFLSFDGSMVSSSQSFLLPAGRIFGLKGLKRSKLVSSSGIWPQVYCCPRRRQSRSAKVCRSLEIFCEDVSDTKRAASAEKLGRYLPLTNQNMTSSSYDKNEVPIHHTPNAVETESPWLTCDVCRSTGFVPCRVCDASGMVQRPNSSNVFFCPQCVGHKKLRCPACGGKCYMCE